MSKLCLKFLQWIPNIFRVKTQNTASLPRLSIFSITLAFPFHLFFLIHQSSGPQPRTWFLSFFASFLLII